MVHFKCGVRSFSAPDMIEVLKAIRAESDPKAKIALFWDNAGIHRAGVVREAAASEEINIELVFNQPYRPDLNGIELLWRKIKDLYKKKVDWLKANNRQWDQ